MRMFPFLLLPASASADHASQLFRDILPWLIVLIALVIVGGVVIYYVKRLTTAGAGSAAEPFTLQGLRELRASGQITDDEFERARAAMIGRLTAPESDETAKDEPEADDSAGADNLAVDNGPDESGNAGDEQKSP